MKVLVEGGVEKSSRKAMVENPPALTRRWLVSARDFLGLAHSRLLDLYLSSKFLSLMTRTYRFNRPVSLLFLTPMLLLIVMLTVGLLREFSVLPFVLTLFSFGILAMVVYFSLLRSLTIGPEGLKWKAPRSEMNMNWEELKHFGIVKYRSFRFLYFSRNIEKPFEAAQARIVTSEETFVLQYREKAWKQVQEFLKEKRPDLEATFMERGR
jgi:hypothetical protein